MLLRAGGELKFQTFGWTGALSSVNSNEWSHIAITYDGDIDQLKFYINNINVKTVSSYIPNGDINGNDLYIGKDHDLATSFNGTIDEVKIWNRALTPEEINASYNTGLYRLETNFTDLEGGTYNYTAYVQDLAGNVNQTETRNVTINTSSLQCGTLDTANTVYTLTQNVSSDDTCFIIAADNITLDCDGYRINYSTTATGYGVNNTGYENFTVKNCIIEQITGTGRGIYLKDADGSSADNNNITIKHANTYNAIAVESSDYVNLSNNNLVREASNGQQGIYLVSSRYSTLINNTISSPTTPTQSLLVYGTASEHYNHTIDGSNLADGKPIKYYHHLSDSVIENNDSWGQLVIGWSDNLTFRNISISNADGIIISRSSNITLENCTLLNSTGVYLRASNQNKITSSYIHTLGNYNSGIYTHYSSYNDFENVTVYVSSGGSGRHGISSNGASNNRIISSDINSSTSPLLLAYGSSNWQIINSTLVSINDIGFRTYSTSINNTMTDSTISSSQTHPDITVGTSSEFTAINTTFNKSDVTVSTDSNLIVKWYLDVYVNDTSGNPVNQANVTAWQVNSTQEFTELTASSGYIIRQTLTEYTHNATQVYPDNVTYSTNYTVNANLSGYTNATQEVNLTENKNIYLTLQDSDLSCGTLSTPDTVYTLTSNVSSDGTCFTIKADNITLDCNGYTINYSQSSLGYAIDNIDNSDGYEDITIKNCNIIQGSPITNAYAIYFDGAQDGNISNNNITTDGTNAYGIYLISASYLNTVEKNIITTTGVRGTGIRTANSNSVNMTNNTVTTTGRDANGIYIASGSYSVLSNNTLTTSNAHSLYLDGGTTLAHYNHTIDTTNLADGKPILYIFNNDSGIFENYDNEYGQILIVVSTNVTLRNITMTGRDGIHLMNSSGSTVENSNLTGITGYGIGLMRYSMNNVLQNNIISTDAYYQFGLYLASGSASNTILNNTIATVKSDATAVYMRDTDTINNSFVNNSIKTIGASYSTGVYAYLASNNTFTNNIINTTSTAGHGIYFTESSNNTLYNNTIITAGNFANGIIFRSGSTPSSNNRIYNTSITSQNYNDIYVRGTEDITNYLINSTFDQSSVDFLDSAQTDKIEIQWYLDVYINNTQGNPVNQANITAWQVNSTQEFTELAASSGYIIRQTLTEYTHNATQVYPDNVTYSTNYTVNATKFGYDEATKQVNLTESKEIYLTIYNPAPAITIDYPENNSYMNDNTSQMDASISDDDINSAWYSLDSGSNVSCNSATTCLYNLTKNWVVGSGDWNGNVTMDNITTRMVSSDSVIVLDGRLTDDGNVIHLWNFDTGFGTTVINQISGSDNLTLTNSVAWNNQNTLFGPFDIYCNGIHRAYKSTTVVPNIPNDGTVEMWFMPDKIIDSSTTELRLLDWNYVSIRFLASDGRISAAVHDGVSWRTSMSAQNTWNPNEIYKIDLTWGASGNVTLYVNDVAQSPDTGYDGTVGDVTNVIGVGGNRGTLDTYQFNGTVGDTRISYIERTSISMYPSSGNLTSITKDAEQVEGTGSTWNQIKFDGTVPEGTNISIWSSRQTIHQLHLKYLL